ncbi:MAG: bifunctional 23S rRNA (guanine(2069)-N(7))-methyltransferase RlmK/23S rRNA (guanine(2445)-N(2))-methyltransferase RlmL [Proteobacteria bacterium]|nr:bifunctional 23S rRNA (guanine(2069)-N(7))-methyltransferase RlmK/23S rRNA (guanine(2445)-N(2))-methyltransferase RlmL [Pseudomonadota bacterium]
MQTLQFLASAPRGLADLLARELVTFGAEGAKERSTGVAFFGSLRTAYRACLESRIANRVFLELGRFEVADAEGFYRAAREIDWSAHLAPGATLACDFSGRHPLINHTHFGALKLKDAIVDSLRESTGSRPDIALDRPDVRVHAHANGAVVTVSLDLSGESLHRRGYRGAAGEAPLKENVAAGMLMRCGWSADMAAAGAQFLDPMCGSGTLVIEAALIAADIAPGLGRDYYGFMGWRGHQPAVWQEVLEAAKARAGGWLSGPGQRAGAPESPWPGQRAGTPASPWPGPSLIRGSDRDRTVIRVAQANADRAGVGRMVQFEVRALADAAPALGRDTAPTAAEAPSAWPGRAANAPASTADAAVDTREPTSNAAALPTAPGLLCVNPPYGVRLEDHDIALATHRELGRVLRERFQGWIAGVLIGSPELGMELGVRAYRTHALWNGALECRLLRLKIDADSAREPGRFSKPDASLRESPGAQMFGNRLGKNLKRLQTWASRSDISCYRLYDADMPEYAFAIDLYRTLDPDQTWLYVQEYAAPAEIELDAVRRRRNEALSVLPEVTGVPEERIQVRTRRKNKRGEQYKKVDEQAHFHYIREAGLKFRVNFADYLDTGLFLDHRITRARLREAAEGKRFLNLFAYTGTATVYAAAGGATSTTSVDLSRTYLDWAQRNLSINGFHGSQHEIVQADCREWLLASATRSPRYDLVFLDPPTFSNSKRMEGVLDIERDHVALIDACARLLAPGGLLVFSTNAQKFKLDDALGARYDIRDISTPTLPKDFERNPRIHRCFEIRSK